MTLISRHRQTMNLTIALLMAMTMMMKVDLAEAKSGAKTIYILQPDRSKATLQKDYALIAKGISKAKTNDSIQVISTHSAEVIVSLESEKRLNALQWKKQRQRAIAGLKQYCLELVNNPPKKPRNQLAQALIKTMDLLNYSDQPKRMIIVLLNDGLQEHQISFRGYVPSDSFLMHPDSPFAHLKPNSQKAPLYVVMVADGESYVDSYHAAEIERWYLLLCHLKLKTSHFAMTLEHKAAEKMLTNLSRLKPKEMPQVKDLYGNLRLISLAELTVE